MRRRPRHRDVRFVVQHGATRPPRLAEGHEFLAHDRLVALLAEASRRRLPRRARARSWTPARPDTCPCACRGTRASASTSTATSSASPPWSAEAGVVRARHVARGLPPRARRRPRGMPRGCEAGTDGSPARDAARAQVAAELDDLIAVRPRRLARRHRAPPECCDLARARSPTPNEGRSSRAPEGVSRGGESCPAALPSVALQARRPRGRQMARDHRRVPGRLRALRLHAGRADARRRARVGERRRARRPRPLRRAHRRALRMRVALLDVPAVDGGRRGRLRRLDRGGAGPAAALQRAAARQRHLPRLLGPGCPPSEALTDLRAAYARIYRAVAEVTGAG